MKKSVRKGFTLVELLIVIVVIGILSAMMMLSSTEAVSSARAADIVSDLRNLKTAALAFYADNIEVAEATGFSLSLDGVVKYLGTASVDAKYSLTSNTVGWFAVAKVSDTKVQEKLAGRAKTVGLMKDATSADNNYYVKGTSENSAYYPIR